MIRCECEYTRCGTWLAEWALYPLRGRELAAFALFRCEGCGGILARPDSELTRALEVGTPRTLRRLQELTRLH